MEVKNKDSSFQVPSSFDDINLGLLVHVLKRGIIPLILLRPSTINLRLLVN